MANLDDIIKNSAKKISFDKDSPFSEQGFSKLKEEISAYIVLLVDESFRIARHEKSDKVSHAHVESASAGLVKKKNKEIVNVFISIGGFLIGMSITKTFEILANSEMFTTQSTLIILATGIVGAFLLGLNIFRSH